MRTLLLLLLSGCALFTPKEKPFMPSSWGIQLQGYDKEGALQRIRDSRAELWVVDREIPVKPSWLKTHGKKLLSYQSIGEAESYRSYFKGLPKKLLGPENPHWPGSFTAHFWEPEWQELQLKVLDQIIAKGFDGVFLDVIDVFERFPDRAQKAQAMAAFIQRLSAHAKEQRRDFLIVPQNGTHIIGLLSDRESYLESIDGVNIENVFYEKGSLTATEETLTHAQVYQQANKFILSLEYVKDSQRQEYFSFARSKGLIPLAAEKSLAGELFFP